MSPQPFVSGLRSWKVNKEASHQGVVLDFSAKTLSYDKKRYWIRFETQSKLYVYSMEGKP